MKTSTRIIVWLLPLLLTVLACGAELAGPEIFVSLPGIGEGVVEQGEPVRVVVRLRAPRESRAALTLGPASGNWTDVIAIELTPAEGGSVVARGIAVGLPASPIAILDAEHVAGGLWRFPATATRQILPGNYAVRARLAIMNGSGWTGEAESESAEIRVVAAGSGDAVRRAVNLAQDALLDARVEAAASILDQALAQFPDQSRLLLGRGEVALRAGNWRAAAVCLNRWRQISPARGDGPPPAGWQELKARINLAQDSASTTSEPPPWSWPRHVMDAFSQSVIEEANRAAKVPAAQDAVSSTVASTTAEVNTSSMPTPTSTKPETAPISSTFAGTVVPELTEAKILADANGQWAASAKAGSEYGTPNYGATQMTGAPDVPNGNDSPKAWCHHSSSKGLEWIELTYAKPVHATEVRVRQTYNPGAIVKVEAIDSDGAAHLWWKGVDPARPPGALNAVAWFAVRVPKTDYLVAKIKLTLDLDAVASWQEIDAVQLVGEAPAI